MTPIFSSKGGVHPPPPISPREGSGPRRRRLPRAWAATTRSSKFSRRTQISYKRQTPEFLDFWVLDLLVKNTAPLSEWERQRFPQLMVNCAALAGGGGAPEKREKTGGAKKIRRAPCLYPPSPGGCGGCEYSRDEPRCSVSPYMPGRPQTPGGF